MTNSLERNIASLWGLGEKTKFPGTLASFVCLIFSFLSYYFFDEKIHTILFFIFLILGYWAIHVIHKSNEPKDYSWIVIDEWIGMWLASFFLFESDFTLVAKIWVAIGVFVIFRIIDIIKFIPPINIIDKKKEQTAISVILDDIIAGCYSYAVLMIAFGFYNISFIYSSFLILLPAIIANMTPVLLGRIRKFSRPMNEEIFGKNKTWRGFLGGIFAGTLSYPLLLETNFIHVAQNANFIFLLGFLLSFGALTGDLVKSYFKRKIGKKEGEGWVPWDQIDYVLGAIIATYFIYDYSFKNIVLMLIIGGIMSALAHRFAYLIKIINTKW